jgi:predicted methyltransferase
LPPVRRGPEQGCQITPEQRAEFDAIGESDRMTLRFRKPG